MDDYEPELNRMRPKDPRDTTTPRAVAADYQKLVLGDALTADKRALLKDWLSRALTGAKRVRAGLPKGWARGRQDRDRRLRQDQRHRDRVAAAHGAARGGDHVRPVRVQRRRPRTPWSPRPRK